MKRRRKKRSNRGGSKVQHDGVSFSSGLEKYCYIQLKKHKLFEKYEGEVFELVEGFAFSQDCYSRQANGKGDYCNRTGRKILNIKYTPDFTGRDYIIETKGFANESFPMRWKLFKKWLVDNEDDRAIYKPQTQKEVDTTIRLILEKRENE